MSENIVTRLLNHPLRCMEGDECPNCLMENEAVDEIERLRAELKDADDDFHALKAMFDKMRADRDHWRSLADLAHESLFNPTRTIGECLEPYERAVRDE